MIGLCFVSKNIPTFFKNLLLGQNIEPLSKEEDPIHLSSFSIEKGTIPESWPLATVLESGNALNPSQLTITSVNDVQERCNRMFNLLYTTFNSWMILNFFKIQRMMNHQFLLCLETGREIYVRMRPLNVQQRTTNH